MSPKWSVNQHVQVWWLSIWLPFQRDDDNHCKNSCDGLLVSPNSKLHFVAENDFMCSRGWSKPDPSAASLFSGFQPGYNSWQAGGNHAQHQNFPALAPNIHSPALQPSYQLQSAQANPIMTPGTHSFQHMGHVHYQNVNSMEAQHLAAQRCAPTGANFSGGGEIAPNLTFMGQDVYQSPGNLSLHRSITAGGAECTLRTNPRMHQDAGNQSRNYRQTVSDGSEFMTPSSQDPLPFTGKAHTSHGFGGGGSEQLESMFFISYFLQCFNYDL